MDPLVAELADMADAELQWTLIPEQRDGALRQAFDVVLERIGQQRQRSWAIHRRTVAALGHGTVVASRASRRWRRSKRRSLPTLWDKPPT